MNKISEAGIIPATEMMIGTDSDTAESIRRTFDFVMKTRIPIPKFYILTPMPGSVLYEEYKNIESGDYLTEEQFEKKNKVKIH